MKWRNKLKVGVGENFIHPCKLRHFTGQTMSRPVRPWKTRPLETCHAQVVKETIPAMTRCWFSRWNSKSQSQRHSSPRNNPSLWALDSKSYGEFQSEALNFSWWIVFDLSSLVFATQPLVARIQLDQCLTILHKDSKDSKDSSSVVPFSKIHQWKKRRFASWNITSVHNWINK